MTYRILPFRDVDGNILNTLIYNVYMYIMYIISIFNVLWCDASSTYYIMYIYI